MKALYVYELATLFCSTSILCRHYDKNRGEIQILIRPSLFPLKAILVFVVVGDKNCYESKAKTGLQLRFDRSSILIRMGGAHHCSAPRIQNDLYCVELDVKLYYTIPFSFDCNSNALRPFDDLRYDRRPTFVWAASASLRQISLAWLQLAGYVTVSFGDVW